MNPALGFILFIGGAAVIAYFWEERYNQGASDEAARRREMERQKEEERLRVEEGRRLHPGITSERLSSPASAARPRLVTSATGAGGG